MAGGGSAPWPSEPGSRLYLPGRRLQIHRAAGPSALGQPHERLEVALRPGQPRARVAEHGGAEPARGLADTDQRAPAMFSVPRDPSLPDQRAPNLELGLPPP